LLDFSLGKKLRGRDEHLAKGSACGQEIIKEESLVFLKYESVGRCPIA
jgi:hypothetical protein